MFFNLLFKTKNVLIEASFLCNQPGTEKFPCVIVASCARAIQTDVDVALHVRLRLIEKLQYPQHLQLILF